MRKLTIRLPLKLHRVLKEAARREGKSQAELIREALSLYPAGRGEPRPRSLGAGEDPELSGRALEKWLEEAWAEQPPRP